MESTVSQENLLAGISDMSVPKTHEKAIDNTILPC